MTMNILKLGKTNSAILREINENFKFISPKVYKYILSAEGWNENKQALNNEIFELEGFLYIPYGDDYSSAGITMSIEDGKVEFTAERTPASDITVYIRKQAIEYCGEIQNEPVALTDRNGTQLTDREGNELYGRS